MWWTITGTLSVCCSLIGPNLQNILLEYIYVISEWFQHTDYMHQCCYAHASGYMIRFHLLYDHVCTLVHYRMWWTITGNFGNLLPIDWSKSYARQLHTKVLHLQDRRVSHRQGHCPAALTVLDRP